MAAAPSTSTTMDQDKEEVAKKTTIDMVALEKDIAAAKSLAAQGQLTASIEALLNLEKTARLAEEVTATKICCEAVLGVCFEAKNWKLLEENVVVLSKRRAQLKQAVQAFVRQAMSYIDHTPDKETKVSLIETLQTVTEGKIYVEIERARLTRRLAAMKESEGDINTAADILQEVAVETFGAMAKTEKIAFILEQVRLCLDKQDYVRAQILSKKISPKAFVERKGEGKGEIGIEGTAIEAPDEGIPELPELKLKYYELMIRYYSYNNNYLEMCRCYKAVFECPQIIEDSTLWMPVLKKICWLIVLSPSYSTAQGSTSDRLTLLTTTQQDKKLSELAVYKQLLTTFTTDEIIRWSVFQQTYGSEMEQVDEIFGGTTGAQRQADLKLRATEHNILVISRYYTRITTQRLCELLDLPLAEAEKHLSDLVVAKAVCAKIDRPSAVVRMGKRQEPEQLLNVWGDNISKLLELVEKSCQQIQKEAMVHKVALTSSAS